MKETLIRLWGRAAATTAPLFQKLLTGGRVASLVRGSLFVGAASTVGLYLALTLFVPDDLVLSKINGALAGRGVSVEAKDVGYSIFLSATLEDGSVLSEGETLLTFGELTISPSLWSLLTGAPSVTVTIEDVDEQGGVLEIAVGSGEEPCYHLEADEMPLSLLRALWPEVRIGGALSGTAEFCKEKKLSGELDLTATPVTLGGKVYGLELEKNILLGEVVLSGAIKDNKLDIRKMTAVGDLDMQVEGKVTLNPQNYKSSRLDISADLKEKKEGAIKQVPLLEMALSRFKDPAGGYALKISGMMSSPSVRRDMRTNRPARTAKPDFGSGNDARPSEKEKEKEKSPARAAAKKTEEEPPAPAAPEEKDKDKNPDTEENP